MSPERPGLAARWAPTRVEVTAGRLIGRDPATPRLPRPERRSPRAALEAVLARALARPPCVVSFSGGRDSSAVLAVAAEVARREGLPAPVPTTLVFPHLPETDEREWQETVVRHIGLTEWERIECGGELDLLGSLAAGVLETYGAHWPPTANLQIPVVRVAAGGTVLTGLGGDEVFGTPGSHLMRVLAGRARPRRRDLALAGYTVLPARLRSRRLLARAHGPQAWLTTEGAELVAGALAHWEAGVPERWSASLDTWWTSREVQASSALLAHLGRASDVVVSHPLMEPQFLASMRLCGGIAGFRSRADVMRDCFADVLPEAAITRVSKAVFDRAVRSQATQDFVDRWDGSGLEDFPVRPEVLREVWAEPGPCFPTFLLLQSAWLANRGS